MSNFPNNKPAQAVPQSTGGSRAVWTPEADYRFIQVLVKHTVCNKKSGLVLNHKYVDPSIIQFAENALDNEAPLGSIAQNLAMQFPNKRPEHRSTSCLSLLLELKKSSPQFSFHQLNHKHINMWTRSIVPFRHLYENGVLFKGKSIFHKDCKRFARCIMRFLAYHEANGQDAPFKNIFGGGTGDGNRQLEQWLNAMFEQHDYEMAHFLFQCACKMARSYIKSKPSRHVTSEETVYLASADPQISQVLEIIKSYFTQITEFEGLASGARAECDTPNTPNHRPSSANSRPFKPFSSSTAGTNLNTGFLGDTNDNAPYTHGRRMSATLPAIGFSSSFALYPSGEPYSSSALSGTDGSFYNDQQSIFRQQQLLRNQQYAKEREELLRQQLTREQKAIQEHMDRVQRPQSHPYSSARPPALVRSQSFDHTQMHPLSAGFPHAHPYMRLEPYSNRLPNPDGLNTTSSLVRLPPLLHLRHHHRQQIGNSEVVHRQPRQMQLQYLQQQNQEVYVPRRNSSVPPLARNLSSIHSISRPPSSQSLQSSPSAAGPSRHRRVHSHAAASSRYCKPPFKGLESITPIYEDPASPISSNVEKTVAASDEQSHHTDALPEEQNRLITSVHQICNDSVPGPISYTESTNNEEMRRELGHTSRTSPCNDKSDQADSCTEGARHPNKIDARNGLDVLLAATVASENLIA